MRPSAAASSAADGTPPLGTLPVRQSDRSAKPRISSRLPSRRQPFSNWHAKPEWEGAPETTPVSRDQRSAETGDEHQVVWIAPARRNQSRAVRRPAEVDDRLVSFQVGDRRGGPPSSGCSMMVVESCTYATPAPSGAQNALLSDSSFGFAQSVRSHSATMPGLSVSNNTRVPSGDTDRYRPTARSESGCTVPPANGTLYSPDLLLLANNTVLPPCARRGTRESASTSATRPDPSFTTR